MSVRLFRRMLRQAPWTGRLAFLDGSVLGVRMALGAGGAQVTGLVLSRAATIAAIGLIVGVLLSLASGRMIRSMVVGIETLDPFTYGGVLIAVFESRWRQPLFPRGGRCGSIRFACCARTNAIPHLCRSAAPALQAPDSSCESPLARPAARRADPVALPSGSENR
jgi:hypothetical protein